MQNSLKENFEIRLDQFRDGYGFQEPNEAVSTLAVTGEILDLIFENDEAAMAMTALKEIVAHGIGRTWNWAKLDKVETDKNWRETWADFDAFDKTSTPPFLDELHDLNAFANFGIMPIWNWAGGDTIETPEARHMKERLEAVKDAPLWVESVCQKIDKLERLAQRNEKGTTEFNYLIGTRNMARARIKLDLGQAITIHDLALLSCVSVKRIQNAVYAKTDEAPVVDKNGLISPEACEPWLTARDYFPSIWKAVAALYPLGSNWGDDVPYGPSESSKIIDDFIFVPVANDGTMFTPSLSKMTNSANKSGVDRGYTIGGKGAETTVEDYQQALNQLSKMETAKWRRPNAESGNWGIVSAQSWKRIRLSELEAL